MKKKTILLILLLMGLCLSWFAAAKWKEGKPPAPGWKHRVGMDTEIGRVEMWLPPDYENIDPQFMTRMLQSSVEESGLPAEWHSKARDTQIVYAAQDIKQDGSGTRLLVTYSIFEPTSGLLERTPEEWIARAAEFPMGELLEGTKVKLGDRELPRIVFKMRLAEQEGILVQYLIRDGAVLWFPVFAIDTQNYETVLPVCDRIIETFEVIGNKDQ